MSPPHVVETVNCFWSDVVVPISASEGIAIMKVVATWEWERQKGIRILRQEGLVMSKCSCKMTMNNPLQERHWLPSPQERCRQLNRQRNNRRTSQSNHPPKETTKLSQGEGPAFVRTATKRRVASGATLVLKGYADGGPTKGRRQKRWTARTSSSIQQWRWQCWGLTFQRLSCWQRQWGWRTGGAQSSWME